MADYGASAMALPPHIVRLAVALHCVLDLRRLQTHVNSYPRYLLPCITEKELRRKKSGKGFTTFFAF